jgi:hypothetical protein
VTLRVALDATPLLGQPTGVGEFVRGLLGALAVRDDVWVTAFGLTWRGREALHSGGRCARGDRGFQHYFYGVMLKRLQTVHVGHEGTTCQKSIAGSPCGTILPASSLSVV